ncbi:PIG-L deacetylase family protein [Occultella gossypii]|uniref:PIG-L family deacetylase n=1 Tax=Occultella gossypii TaxID=2800820 RepID=A0ABS7SH92_9MICO|nr:PIG-L family deacetylase [Occultella gossypii]MBZ2199520.1 PIG-L family deacetylase [Occultella gossypii]
MPTAMLLHAHPDDEVFANFGWAYDLASRGYDVIGVIATGGEANELHATASLREARTRRIEKYERALDMLGASAWTWLDASAGWVDAPSGPSLAGAAPDQLRVGVERLLTQHRPDIVLTVGSDGLTGHPDHVAIARALSTATNRGSVPEGVWGARLRADDVRAGGVLVGSHAREVQVGSGRVVGTTARLVARDVRSSAAARRRALDVYREGLGTDSLESIVSGADRIGDSIVLRGVFDATGWGQEYYEAVSPDHGSTAARQNAAC